MPTSARWEVANLPQISVKPVHSAGGQSRPPLQERAGGVVGADDSVGPKNITNSPRIPVKPVQSARADVGIGPYNEIWWCTRGCIGLCFFAAACCNPSDALRQFPFRGAFYSSGSSAAVSGSCISSKAFWASSKITCTSANASCRRERPVDRSAASAAISSPESM